MVGVLIDSNRLLVEQGALHDVSHVADVARNDQRAVGDRENGKRRLVGVVGLARAVQRIIAAAACAARVKEVAIIPRKRSGFDTGVLKELEKRSALAALLARRPTIDPIDRSID